VDIRIALETGTHKVLLTGHLVITNLRPEDIIQFILFEPIIEADPNLVKLEHIGIAVKDIEASRQLFETLLGARPYKSEEVTSEGVITHFYDAGGTKIELLESTSSTSAIARFLEKKGPGIHHLAFSVEDADRAFEEFGKKGLRVLGEKPKKGADGKTIFFVHPSDTEGVLMEFCS